MADISNNELLTRYKIKNSSNIFKIIAYVILTLKYKDSLSKTRKIQLKHIAIVLPDNNPKHPELQS